MVKKRSIKFYGQSGYKSGRRIYGKGYESTAETL